MGNDGGETTVLPGELTRGLGPRSGGTRPALVLSWSREEPDRVGELVLFTGSKPLLLGRGPARASDQVPRGGFVRQRPGTTTVCGPLDSAGISRQQLVVTPIDGALEVANIGRCPLLVDGQVVDRARIAPGQSVELGRQLLLTHVRRPARLPALRAWPRSLFPPFGRADEHGFVGESPATWALRDRLAFVAARKPHVLLLGASGSGKELAARALHALSDRAGRRLVARNAATLPEGLVDAELFGNVKDYPNPGMKERVGLIGEANGSVLFLDEIAELPESLQAHMLRVLDGDGDYQRLGDARTRRADVRLIAATNRPADALKHDLLARIKMRVELPGLGERIEDIPLLAAHLVRLIADEDPGLGDQFCEGGVPRLAPDFVDALLRHPWTHHVRELDAVLWASIGSSSGSWLEATKEARAELSRQASSAPIASPETLDVDALQAALARHDWVKDRVWKDLGLKNRWVLDRLIKKHGLSKDD